MFTAFMDDAANIMSFHGDLNVEEGGSYAVELWMYKQQRSGRQVLDKIFYVTQSLYSCSLAY